MSDKTNKTVNTAELLKILGKKDVEYSEFLEIGEDSFIDNNLIVFWTEQVKKCGLQNIDIINRADIGYTFFYDIINGKKKPSREKLIRLFLAMKSDLSECQSALRIYCYADLYAKNKRDSIFIYALTHKLSINQLNDLLKSNGEEDIK